ncbi:UDP-N-acetylmuramoyl-tripeptide--D-alanyl-D-alanine ligase [Membranicola marinus]|uniref:UDP-N-acetylmuramoyl-tripeptide--D-alanyl-D-alanine ligase n=1 Tax=Membranihabitans marinus TaxID=1227546 RepID=A0A953HU26_9BACT|nr:UDP-N-acetylmuramoyl-tripeptide--D-alanyl-D-alanine ligase [Membranihabitans marinus]MBY5957888.1 UDP-N-acetylmuramoyl-tripeptide--D-alanyl-D-alanine ligase [Membranihabitans marinus]
MKKDLTLLDLLLESTGADIDSRTIEPGNLFFALPGSKTDGSRFASDALEKGARAVIVARDSGLEGDDYWLVEDVLQTMQQLAGEYRRWLNVPVLAITGSNGKTTNKNLLAAALGTKYQVHATAGNFNNHIGLPLTLLNAPKETEFLLLEMGTNHFGEIATLCEIAQPNYGSILNIGKSHLEFLHSVEGVLKAKAELADYLNHHDGYLFLNLEEDSLGPLKSHPVQKIRFDRNHLPETDYVVEMEKFSGGIELRLKSKNVDKTLTLKSSLWGGHNVQNLIHALAVSSYFKTDLASVVEALAGYVPKNNRSQILTWKGHRVYLDAYNANPTSMRHSISFFREEYPHQGVLILGDMGELGAATLEEHQSILELIDALGFEQVWLVGEYFRMAAGKEYPHFNFCPEVEFVDERAIQKGDPILIKGSRSMELERLVGG